MPLKQGPQSIEEKLDKQMLGSGTVNQGSEATPRAPSAAPETKPQSPAESPAQKKVTTMAAKTGEDALQALKPPKKRLFRKPEFHEVSIADRTFKTPEEVKKARETFLQAIEMVKAHLSKFPHLKVELSKIKFQELADKIVGQSTAEGITLDPIMLLHPVTKLATVLFHEILHNNNQIPNEGLVHTNTLFYMQNIDTPEKYNRATEQMKQFATIYDSNGDTMNGSMEIYKLYYSASSKNKPQYYRVIFDRFMKRATSTRFFGIGAKAKDAAKKFFQEVFPELQFDEGKNSKNGKNNFLKPVPTASQPSEDEKGSEAKDSGTDNPDKISDSTAKSVANSSKTE